MQAPGRAHRSYNPGELAPVSGIYRVLHHEHRTAHEVVIVRGEELPVCRTCRAEVRFRIVRPLSHVAHDWDFAGPKAADWI